MMYLLGQRSEKPDSTAITEILDQFIVTKYTSAPGWRSLSDLDHGRTPKIGPDSAAVAPGSFLLEDALTETVRRKWKGRVPLISEAALDTLSDRQERSVTSVYVERRVGPFVEVHVLTSGSLARGEDESPYAYASGYTLFLMKLGNAWVIVREGSSWAT